MTHQGTSLTCAAIAALLTCALLVPSSSAATAAPRIFQVTGRDHERLFKSFVIRYGKVYGSNDEYAHRLGVFTKNLVRAAEHQAMDPTAVHGVTPFMDLTPDEFERTYFGLNAGGGSRSGGLAAGAMAPPLDVKDLPQSFDWRDKGAVTDVKMQGTCGSCWAFSTTGAIEGANFIATGELLNLSQQQLVDCDHKCDMNKKDECDSGCRGGLMTNAYNYLMEAGGLQEASSYPYTGVQGECKFDPDKVAVKIANFTNIPIDDDQIAAHLVHHGPLAVGLNAVFMQTYIGGVSCPLICGKKWLNHGVLLVGYGAKGYSILRFGYKPYWIIKNSWGERWGENGYYRLCRGHNMCGMNTMVSAVVTATS